MITLKDKKMALTMKRGLFLVLALLITHVTEAKGAEKGQWPLRFTEGDEEIALYEPQIEMYKSPKRAVIARSAFSVKAPRVAMKFGAVRYRATVEKTGSKGPYRFSDIDILDIKFPGASKWRLENIEARLQGAVGKEGFVMDRASFETGTAALRNGGDYNHNPPQIYYEESPAVLVYIDGDPVLEEVEGGYFKYVVNTAYFIVLNPDDNTFYLKGGKWWYRAREISGDWRPVEKVPARIRKLAAEAFKNQSNDRDTSLDAVTSPPKVIVTTVPAELIVLNGAPNFASVEGTGLLYVDNSENDILLHIDTQQYYALFSGRWYRTDDLANGRWVHVPSKELPEDFYNIQESSSMANVLASVPGTDAAGDAVLNNTIPEVAEVDRRTATVSVLYDGDPIFDRIEGTPVYFATNADKTVLSIGERYYVVHGGVWFESASPHGPWQVSTSVPEAVAEIPPSSPVYHVRYVYVYDYTPSVVYVGYTPGYYCSYVYDGTVIYGTGYYYRPWYRRYYFSHPVTWGFGVHYHPYVGWWGFPVGVSYGWLSFAWFPFPCAYWGPAGYMYGYRHGYYHSDAHGYYHGYRNGYRHGYSAGRSAGYRASVYGEKFNPRANASLYHHRKDVVRNSAPRVTRARRIPPTPNRSAFSGSPDVRARTGRPAVGRYGDANRSGRLGTPVIRSSDRSDAVRRSVNRERVQRPTTPTRSYTPQNRPQRNNGSQIQRKKVRTPSKPKIAPARTNRAPSAPKVAPTRTYRPPQAPKVDRSDKSEKKTYKGNSPSPFQRSNRAKTPEVRKPNRSPSRPRMQAPPPRSQPSSTRSGNTRRRK